MHSELAAELSGPKLSAEPRAGAVLPPGTLVPLLAVQRGTRAVLVHQTRFSRQIVAAGSDHLVASAPPHEATGEAGESLARWSLTTTAEPGAPVRLVKLLAYHWAPEGDPASLVADVQRSLDRAGALGFEALAARQGAALDAACARADIELDGDPEIQHALATRSISCTKTPPARAATRFRPKA